MSFKKFCCILRRVKITIIIINHWSDDMLIFSYLLYFIYISIVFLRKSFYPSLIFLLLNWWSDWFCEIKFRFFIFRMIIAKFLINPHFDFTLIIYSDHFLTNFKLFETVVEVIKANKTFKENISTFLEGHLIFYLIERYYSFSDNLIIYTLW